MDRVRTVKRSGGFQQALMISSILVPAVLYIAFLNGVQNSFPGIWIKTLLAASALYFVLSIAARSLLAGAASYFMLGLALATISGVEGFSWLRMAYIPYVFIGPLVFGGWGALAFAISVAMFEARSLISGPGPEQWALVSFAALAGILGLVSLLRRERSVREKPRRRGPSDRSPVTEAPQGENEYDVAPPVDMEGLMREDDESLRDLLRITVFATRASGISLFVLSSDRLRLRISSYMQSSGDGIISPVPMWYINDAHRYRHAIVTGNLGAETTEGFINRAAPMEGGRELEDLGQGVAASVAAVPVILGNTVMGVLAVNSSRSNAFRGNTVTVLELLSSQVARTLSGIKVREENERHTAQLQQVMDESFKLATSIDLKEIAAIVADVMEELSSMEVHVYVKTPSGFALIRHSDGPVTRTGRVEFEGTLAAMALDNREKLYISSLEGYSKPLLPDQGDAVYASALLLPMISRDDEGEDRGEIRGLVALTSGKRDPLNAETITTLDKVGRQAASSLENSLTHKDTQVKAATDALTGLNNRRSFMDLLEAEHMRFERTGMQYAIIMMDVDFFKKVNDTYGHQAGDEVLREVAALMRESFRATDYLGRYGGEEFAAVLVNSDRSGAFRLAERMRRAVELKRMDTSSGVFSVTMSLGIALAGEGLEPEEVIKRADEALYRAKGSGRNRTEFG